MRIDVEGFELAAFDLIPTSPRSREDILRYRIYDLSAFKLTVYNLSIYEMTKGRLFNPGGRRDLKLNCGRPYRDAFPYSALECLSDGANVTAPTAPNMDDVVVGTHAGDA